MNKKLLIVAGATLLLAALAIGGYFYWKSSQKPPEKISTENTQQSVPETAVDLSESATQGVIPSLNTNPLEEKPDINPADKANPFKNVETNPFK